MYGIVSQLDRALLIGVENPSEDFFLVGGDIVVEDEIVWFYKNRRSVGTG